jgi:transposase
VDQIPRVSFFSPVGITLTETAKLNGLDPEGYLHKVPERIADHPVRRVHDLLP